MPGPEYELRLFDRTLLRFRFVDGFAKGTELIDLDEEALHLLPYGLELSHEGVYRWLDARALPINRANADELCRALGIRRGDVESIYRIGLGLSLTDSYWVAPRGLDASFGELNLFENPFSEALGAVACTGHATAGGTLHGLTPDLMTDGTLRKAWRIVEDGTRTLYKGSSAGSHPGEALSEFLAGQIAESIGLDAVGYSLARWDDRHPEACSVCRAFTTKSVSYVPFAVATGSPTPDSLFRYALAFGEEELEAVCSMLVFDALICNTDRHWTNFGFLRDNDTGRLLRFAPVFDNGRSLFFKEPDEHLDELDFLASISSSVTNKGSFRDLAASVIGARQKTMLEALADFSFTRDALGICSLSRRNALTDFVRHRAERFLAMPNADRRAIYSLAERNPEEKPQTSPAVCRAELPARGGGTRGRSLTETAAAARESSLTERQGSRPDAAPHRSPSR